MSTVGALAMQETYDEKVAEICTRLAALELYRLYEARHGRAEQAIQKGWLDLTPAEQQRYLGFVLAIEEEMERA